MEDRGRCERLSEGQKACLRLVADGYETKDIAPLVGLSIDGVNARLNAARRILGVSRRSEAARLLAEYEQDYQRQVYPPLAVPEPAEIGPDAPAPEAGAQEAGNGRRLAVSEERTPYGAPITRQRWRLQWPFPTRGRAQNDLTLIEGVIWIVLGTALLAIAAATILNAYSTLTELWRSAP